ncbi:MAG: response regulator [Caulobacterales bacterium]|nr:response regulator [Caulobacterales bacterium]
MSEAHSREDEAIVAALTLRRRNVGIRCAIACVGALALEPIIGGNTALIWVATFLAIQAVEAAVLGRYVKPDAPGLTGARRFLAAATLFISNVAYGSLSLLMWDFGIAGGACAILILAGGAANAVMNTAGSRLALVSTLTPVMAYLAASPLLLAREGAPPEAVQALSMACLIFGVFVLSAYNQSQKLAQSERTARRIAERRRGELERAGVDKSAFMAAVCHDLRTPLSAILTGATELSRIAHDATERSHATLIHDAGQMMNRLLDDLLDQSRLKAGRMEIEPVAFNLRDLLARTCQFWQGQARAKGLRMVLEGGRHLPTWVQADPVRVRQILNNLLSNAVKFTTSGEVRVRLNAWPTDDDRCALTIEISDTGEGMDADQQKRLFIAFDQTRSGVAGSHGGSGLGLWISRGLAQLMGGQLTVRSRKGVGSNFTLALVVEAIEAPVSVTELPPADRFAAGFIPLPALGSAPVQTAKPVVEVDVPAAAGDPAPDAERPLRVLVVDDHEINRRAIQLILAPLGCEIAQAENGISALEMAAVEAYDVIFMDVRMPEIDGREATRRLRAAAGPNQFVPVIAVTADTAPDDVQACAAAGMTWFVGKPLTPASLLGALQGVLSGESRLEHDDARAA